MNYIHKNGKIIFICQLKSVVLTIGRGKIILIPLCSNDAEVYR